MRYIPSTVNLSTSAGSASGNDHDRYGFGRDLEVAVRGAITKLELDPDTSPEAEFLRFLKIADDDWQRVLKDRIEEYVQRINVQLKTKAGILGYLRVAETKRRTFRPPPITQRPLHPLAEFDMSLPYATRIDAFSDCNWVMQSDATVMQIPTAKSIWHPRNTQAHLSSAGCPFSASF
jgi:hypothetical protein